LHEFLEQEKLSPTVSDKIVEKVEAEWNHYSKIQNSNFTFAIKEMKNSMVKDVSLVNDYDKFKLAELHKEQTVKIASLTAENLKLKESISRIREDEEARAIEHYRPLVTAQYAALLKMAARLNIYQLEIHSQLQVKS
jgi:hypothetical protein